MTEKRTASPWIYEYRKGDHPQNNNGGWGANGFWGPNGEQVLGDDIGWEGGFNEPSKKDAEFIVRACNAFDDLTAQFQAYSIALDRAKSAFSKNKDRMRTLRFVEEFYLEELKKAKEKK